MNNYTLRDQVMAIPEVVKFLQENGLEASHSGNGDVSEPYDASVDLKVYGGNVRPVLNRISRETQMKIWSISRNGPEKKQIHVTF